MMNIIISDEMRQICPIFAGAAISAKVKNTEYSENLWKEIAELGEEFKSKYTPDDIKLISGIEATRHIYRVCGKDPSRYRPSAEALIRRILKGKELYKVDTMVDLINLASMKFGYSIGGFDADKFKGDTLTLGVGKAGEPYEGIGRGMINIEGLPVYRDAEGGVGTPTSDHERTKMNLDTTNTLIIINGYDGNRETVRANAEYIQELLKKYAESDGGEIMEF